MRGGLRFTARPRTGYCRKFYQCPRDGTQVLDDDDDGDGCIALSAVMFGMMIMIRGDDFLEILW